MLPPGSHTSLLPRRAPSPIRLPIGRPRRQGRLVQRCTTQAPALCAPGSGPTPCFFQLSAAGDGTVVRMPFMPSSLSGRCFHTALSFPPPLSPLRLTLRQHRQPHPLSLRNHHGGWGKFAGSSASGPPIHRHPLPESGQSAPGEFQAQAESRSGVHRPYGRRARFLGPGGELRLGLGGQRWNVLGWRRKRDAGSPLSGPLKSVFSFSVILR